MKYHIKWPHYIVWSMEWHLFALPLAPTRSGGATRNFHGYFHGYTAIRFALGYTYSHGNSWCLWVALEWDGDKTCDEFFVGNSMCLLLKCVSSRNSKKAVKRPRNLQKKHHVISCHHGFPSPGPDFQFVCFHARCHLHSEFSQLWPKNFMANFWQLPHDAVLCYLVGEH